MKRCLYFKAAVTLKPSLCNRYHQTLGPAQALRPARALQQANYTFGYSPVIKSLYFQEWKCLFWMTVQDFRLWISE